MDLVYINSYMRSGSTLLGILLSECLPAAYLGELRNAYPIFGEKGHCRCSSSIESCDFWGPVIRSLDKVGNTKQNSRLGTWPVLMNALIMGNKESVNGVLGKLITPVEKEVQASREIAKILDRIGSIHDLDFVIDSSHKTAQLVLMHQLMAHKLKTIWLVRDGRAVVASIKRRQNVSVELAARNWKRFNSFSEKMHKLVLGSHNVIKVRYEDFVTSPNDSVSKIADFLKVDSVEYDGEEIATKQHFLGGSSSISPNSSLNIKLDNRWKSQLSRSDLAKFDRVAGVYNKSLGYE